MQRWQRLDTDHDIPDLAGYNVPGTVRYLDRDAYRAFIEPEYAIHILGKPIDTGLTPQQTIQCIVEHEGDEKVLLDAENPIDLYPDAHEMATCAEHEKVRAFGGSPIKYERGLREIIKFCERKSLVKAPHDLCCAPYLDDPDANDKRVLKRMQQLGVIDAFKIGKRLVDYSHATGPDRCNVCKGWMAAHQVELSPCRKVEGLVRLTRWCKEFAPVNQPLGVAAQSPGGPGGTNGQAV